MIQYLINVIYHKVKNKNHHLSRCRKHLTIQHSFVMTQQSGFRGKVLYDKLTASVILNSERLKAFPLRSRTTQRCPLSRNLFNVVNKALARGNSQQKDIKDIRISKEEVKSSLFSDDYFIYRKS